MRMERRKIPPYRLQEPSLVPLMALGLASCGGGGGSGGEPVVTLPAIALGADAFQDGSTQLYVDVNGDGNLDDEDPPVAFYNDKEPPPADIYIYPDRTILAVSFEETVDDNGIPGFRIFQIDIEPTAAELLYFHDDLDSPADGDVVGYLLITDDTLGINTPSLNTSSDVYFDLVATSDRLIWMLEQGSTPAPDGFEPGFSISSSSGGVSLVAQEPVVTDAPPPDIAAIHENYPGDKPVATVNRGFNFREFSLPEGVADNDLFTINSDGEIKFLAVPDFEDPKDSDKDNTYQVVVERLTHDAVRSLEYIDIVVQDVPSEAILKSVTQQGAPRTVFEYEDLDLEADPLSDYAQHLLAGRQFTNPAGDDPLLLTWSLDFVDDDEFLDEENSVLTQPSLISAARVLIDTAFDAYSAVANLVFVEVGETEAGGTTGDFSFRFLTGGEPDEDRFYTLGLANAYSGNINIYDFRHEGLWILGVPRWNSEFVETIIHEIGHVIGLKHPFEEEGGFPGNPEYETGEGSELSIMSYNYDIQALQPADIEALVYLYDAPVDMI